jgi:glutamine amidotransferase
VTPPLGGAQPEPPEERSRTPSGEHRSDVIPGEHRTIAILDYGMGNLRSASKAFEHVGASVEVTRDHDRVREAEGVVLPGVGAFPRAMEAVRELGLDELLRERRAAGVPLLGICLGMQLLFEDTTELGGAAGIGLLAGSVRALDAGGLKVPQIGWNPVAWRRESPLNRGLPDPVAMYHVHSFMAAPANPEDVVGTAEYGSEFTSVVERANVYGVQFHPEKSGPDGLALLANFVRVCAPAPAAA